MAEEIGGKLKLILCRLFVAIPHGPVYSKKEVVIMGKMVECAKVDPSSGCKHVVRGQTEEEVLKNAAEHAKQHGIREVTPELKAKVKAAIRDEN
jgi:predicted small metal-binding protein